MVGHFWPPPIVSGARASIWSTLEALTDNVIVTLNGWGGGLVRHGCGPISAGRSGTDYGSGSGSAAGGSGSLALAVRAPKQLDISEYTLTNKYT